jgi:CheY-like chemotaxis protein
MTPNVERPSRRVLVVDDDEDSASTLVMLLAHDGHEVRTASGGVEALQVASELRPCVIVLDIRLRDMSGFELASRLRAGDEGAQCLLVAVTGLEGDDVQERCRASGIDHHIVKPIRDFPAFRDLVRTRDGMGKLGSP